LKDDLAFASLGDLGTALRAGEIRSEELTRFSLERLDGLGRELGAVITGTPELAMEQARRADAELRAGHDRGPLHGIPFGVKDVLSTRGIPTTWGAEPCRKQVLDEDASVIERLRGAGAVLVAKLAMVELAGALGYTGTAPSFTGACRNPWSRRHWSGGSSGGSAVAVAAGLTAFAIGSESWGSMLGPAALCGATALRPTYGLVSRHGSMTYAWSLDKLGPMARSAEDCALVLEAIAGRDPRDPTSGGSFAAGDVGREPRRPRIGVPEGVESRIQPGVRAAFERSLETLGEIAELEPVSLPDFPWFPIIATIVDVEGALAFRELIESGAARRLTSPGARVGGFGALLTPGSYYLDAQRARRRVSADMARILSRVDAIAAPTVDAVAEPLDEYASDEPSEPVRDAPAPSPGYSVPSALVAAGNLAGLPGVALPNGVGWRGLPTSLQLVGRPWDEATLLAIAQRFQARTTWHRRRPPGL